MAMSTGDGTGGAVATAADGTFSLDLGATKSNTPDGTKDNRLGEALQFLTMAGFKLQDTIDTAVNAGSILLLVDFQTKDFTSTNAAGLGVKLGVKATAMPAPCSSATDTVCGHHLTGTGVFTVDPSSPTNALLGGKIVGGKFSGGPGDVSLQIAISAGSPPLTLSLLNARAEATAITDTGMDAVIGGEVTAADLTNQVLPAIAGQIATTLAADCAANGTPPGCGCTGSAGMMIIGLFDGDDGTAKDCKVSVAEIAGNLAVKPYITPDVCSAKSCTAPDALSIGLKVHAVKASFPM